MFLLFSDFVFLYCLHFLTLLATKHILQFTMFHKISLQTVRNITEIKKITS